MDLGKLFHALLTGQTPEPDGEPQAYTRVTHTPVKWGDTFSGDAFGEYHPSSGNIVMNQDKLPQSNPNPEYMSNILRHESVHALLPSTAINSLMGYLHANPGVANEGMSNLSNYDSGAGSSVKGLAQEAPAYAVQGYRFGMGDNILKQLLPNLPEGIRKKYLLLLRGGGR